MKPEDFPQYSDGDDATEVIAPFAPGSFFGARFRIEEPLGVGAMGTVFRATDLKENEAVALKVLLKRRHDAELRERFEREAEILRKRIHPAIVQIRGFGYAEGDVPWLAMELIRGETLGARVRRKGRLEPEELAPIVRVIAEALEAAHLRGVVHRDLKPDHVFVLPDDARSPVRIIDFGLSREVTAKRLTKTGRVIGTPRYMAPELITSARNAAPASDIYALGVVLYEALSGQSPFAASDHGQLLGAIVQGRRQPLDVHRPDLPRALGEVLDKAMALDPADRWARPSELAEAFAEAAGVRASVPVRLSTPDGLAPSERPVEAPRTYARALLLGLVGALVAAAATYLAMEHLWPPGR